MNVDLAKNITIWSTLIGSLLFWGIFLIFVSNEIINGSEWITSLLTNNPAVVLCIPLSAIASFCNVLILKITDGPIAFEMIGFKFSGAAGPIVMWVISFLAMCLGVKMLWPL